MTRERLPNRRRSVSSTISFGPHRIHVTVGFTADQRPLEVFARTTRPQSDLDRQIDDAAVLLSRLLQHHDCLIDIHRGLGRLPGGGPASVIAAIVDEACALAAIDPQVGS